MAGMVEGRIDEVAHKVDALRVVLEERGHAGVLMADHSTFAWVTGGGRSHISLGEAPGVAAALVTPTGAYVLTTNIEAERLVEEECAGPPWEVVAYPWYAPDGLYGALAQVTDPAGVVADLPGLGVDEAPAPYLHLRRTLTEPEIARYRRLGADAAAAVEAGCVAADPSWTERQVAAVVAETCVRADILPLVLLVASGERVGQWRHPLPTDGPVAGSILVALTGRRAGLHASLTRIACLRPPDADLLARHEAGCRVDARLMQASQPGRSLSDVFAHGVDQYAAEGFPGEWANHHQGGLTGYAGREEFATPTSSHRLTPNQALAWNPSIRRVKSEDTVVLTRGGIEVLTTTGRWPLLDAGLDASAGGPRPPARPAILDRSAG